MWGVYLAAYCLYVWGVYLAACCLYVWGVYLAAYCLYVGVYIQSCLLPLYAPSPLSREYQRVIYVTALYILYQHSSVRHIYILMDIFY